MPRVAALLLLLTTTAFAQAQQPPPAETKPAAKAETKDTPPPPPRYSLDAWKPVIFKEANISVALPITPKEEVTRYRTPNGIAEDHRFVVPTAEANYQVALTVLSDSLATPEMGRDRFEKLLTSLKTNPQLKWISGGENAYEGNPGIEFKAQIANSRVRLWSRQFFAFGCVYEMTARYLNVEPEMKELKLFMDSFKLLGPPLRRLGSLAPLQETLPDFTPLAQNTYYISAEKLRANALEKPEPVFKSNQKIYARTVSLLVTVSAEGKVLQIEPENAFQSDDEEVVKAAKKWTFKPFLLDGKPIKVQGLLIFKLGPTNSTNK